MSLHTHPLLRAREQVLEHLAVIKTLDSVGYTVLTAAETAGTRPPKTAVIAVPSKIPYFYFGNTQSDASLY